MKLLITLKTFLFLALGVNIKQPTPALFEILAAWIANLGIINKIPH